MESRETTDLREEIVLLQTEINSLLDLTRETILKKYLKRYANKKKKLFLDTEIITIKDFLRCIFEEEYV
jgi:predicted transcriptional regulator